jgi:hypothetical protein
VESAASAEAKDASTGAAQNISEAEIFENDSADGCVSACGVIRFFSDEKRLAE